MIVSSTIADGEAVNGIVGWNIVVKPLDEATDFVALVTSPDYDPTTSPPSGRLFGARGPDRAKAAEAAWAKARASLL